MSIDEDSSNISDIQPVISPKSDETSKDIIEIFFLSMNFMFF